MWNSNPIFIFLMTAFLLVTGATFAQTGGNSTTVQGETKNGKRDGVWSTFDKKGILISKITYDQGVREGPFMMVLAEGVTMKKFGVADISRTQDATMKHEGQYSVDKLEGEYKIWFSNDSLFIHCFYRNGIRDRFWRVFQQDGTLRLDKHLQGGVLHGVYNRYDRNGKLLEFRLCNLGLNVTSTEYAYYSTGKCRTESSFWYDPEDGAKYQHGEIKAFFEDGQLSYSNGYAKGVIHGVWIRHYPNGNLKYKATYHQGKLLLWEDFDEDGNLVPKG
jgi:antitoxin component YwqK of YwqJK toxin-antitoxin module